MGKTLLICLVMLFAPFGACFATNDKVIDDVDKNMVYPQGYERAIHIIANNLHVENRGIIEQYIKICADCTLYLQNSGTISNPIQFENNSHLVQVIKNYNDITKLDVKNSEFSILVQSTEPLKLSDIMSIAGSAGKITLDNAVVEYSPVVSLPVLELVGETTLVMENPWDYDGHMIFSNVTGKGVIEIVGNGLDRLYRAVAFFTDDERMDVYMKIVREADYTKLFDENVGQFINDMLSNNQDNNIIKSINNATNMQTIENLMRRSVMFNPINLMNPIRVFNNLEINATPSELNGIESVKILSDALDMMAVKLRADLFGVYISAYAGELYNSDDINDFSGIMYGANARVRFDDGDVWLDSVLGMTMANFKTDVIFDGKDVTHNPDGSSVYMASGIGRRFKIDSEFYVSPNIGFTMDYARVLNQDKTSIIARSGAVIGYGFTNNEIKYDYYLFVNLQTDNVQVLGFSMNILSVADSAGGSLKYALYRDETGIYHKLSFELNFKF